MGDDEDMTEYDAMIEQAHRNASENSVLRAEVGSLKGLLFRCIIQSDPEAVKMARSMFEFTPIELDTEVPF